MKSKRAGEVLGREPRGGKGILVGCVPLSVHGGKWVSTRELNGECSAKHCGDEHGCGG